MSYQLTAEDKAFIQDTKEYLANVKAGKRELPRYDFTEAEKELQQWYSPKELSGLLKNAAIEASCGYDEDSALAVLRRLCTAVYNTCSFLDKIKEVQP